MGWLFLWLALGFATQMWLCFRVARTSVPLAIATFFLGPVGALYPLFMQHGEEDTSVTTPFIANMACILLLVLAVWHYVTSQSAGGNAPSVEPGIAAAPTEPAPAGATFTATSLGPAPVVAKVAPPPDPVDVLAADLHVVGVQSTVTRLPATTRLPEGVVTGVKMAISSRPGAGNWLSSAPQASASDGTVASSQLSALFLRCAATTTCRGVARAYMAQDPATRPRVLQNGSMLLLISNGSATEAGTLHNVVASAFRHLPSQ